MSKLQLCRTSWTRNSPGLRNNEGRRLMTYPQHSADVGNHQGLQHLIRRVHTTDFHRFQYWLPDNWMMLPRLAVFLRVHQDPSFQRQTLDLSDFGMSKNSSNTATFIWLVVWTPLKNIRQLGWLFPIYGKIKNVPNHQPVIQRSLCLGIKHLSSFIHWRQTHYFQQPDFVGFTLHHSRAPPLLTPVSSQFCCYNLLSPQHSPLSPIWG